MPAQPQLADRVKEDLDLVLRVFAAEDGGCAFAQLWHGFLPKLQQELCQEENTSALQLASIIHSFAKILRSTTSIEKSL